LANYNVSGNLSMLTAQKLPISVYIIAQDEADRISFTINSVKDWADEIVVVDSGSNDDTVLMSQELGAKVMFNRWQGYGPQKRFAEEQCNHKWVINLDADEVISPELAKEIQETFKCIPSPQTAFNFKIKSVYPHETKPGLCPHSYKVVRLYHKDQGRYSDSPIHDRVILKPDTQYVTLKGIVLHKSIRSLSHMVVKTNEYTDLQAQVFFKKQRRISPLRLLIEFPFSFFHAYIRRGYFLHGWYGLIVAHHYAFNRFLRIAKMWEKQIMAKLEI